MPAEPTAKVVFEGLKEFKKALKQVDADLPKEMKSEFKAIASLIAEKVAAKVPVGKTGKARASVKPRASLTYAAIVGGQGKAPYMPWLDFGGTRARSDGTHASTRPFIKTGRYMYPTILEEREIIEAAAERAIVTVARKAGFEAHE